MSATEPDRDSIMEDKDNASENTTGSVENKEQKESSTVTEQKEDQIVDQALDGIANDGSSKSFSISQEPSIPRSSIMLKIRITNYFGISIQNYEFHNVSR